MELANQRGFLRRLRPVAILCVFGLLAVPFSGLARSEQPPAVAAEQLAGSDADELEQPLANESEAASTPAQPAEGSDVLDTGDSPAVVQPSPVSEANSQDVETSESSQEPQGGSPEVSSDDIAAAGELDSGDAAPPLPVTASTTAATSTGFGAWQSFQANMLMGVILVALGIASLVGRYLRRQPTEYVNPALVRRFRQRLSSWWLMCAILVFGLVFGRISTVILFALLSFWALREFITMTPTRRGDHRALFWAIIVITPIQYVLIALEPTVRWQENSTGLYGVYSILIPVYASLLIPARVALSGDPKRFLERSAQITFGLLICVYCLSFAPALVNLQLKTTSGVPWGGSPAGLLFFLVLISQLSDILQWTWGHLVGRRVIAPEISSSRTWEGFAGGTLSTGILGAVLYWATPFQFWEAACISMVVAVMGMFGGMTMSAIKRDRGVNDYGTLVLGHAGVLDRIDSLCFAAPVFFHLTRFFYT